MLTPFSRLRLAFPKSISLIRDHLLVISANGSIVVRSCAISKVIDLTNNLKIKEFDRGLLQGNRSTHFSLYQKRFKHKKRGAKAEDEGDDDEAYSDDEVDEPGSKIITGHMASLRADMVLKSGLGISRSKVETLFYESKIRVNGAKIPKKSHKVYVGDELDVIKGPSPVNETMTIVSRVIVLNAKEHADGEKLVVKMRRYKSLLIEGEDADRM